ncbi:protein NUCLEAR FUSION DEFECTIVE 4-like isoform X1 [Rhododendron vialii]|uniref:protein NUCLEAR FUSION DEFECTIVE 4-like isoform X1 n=1 Tax=Rhododendron vialii TaxID=182163 RepID=UPI00265EA593|nr:protein NUCLEAR FUSION DEFECTIVE 4-like isoform X1 [Rhododendron vialii]
MVGQSRKWMILVASTWIQAFTGTNFDFSSYSSELKSVLGISQLELNYLSVASDMGKAFGWCSGVSLLYFPLWVVMFMAAFMGLLGYGVQWLVIRGVISLPYFLVFLLCLLAGCSICWFNTVCYVLCIRNFPANRPLALSLSISFNGVSAALYTLIANAVSDSDSNYSLYLLLNALVPLLTSSAALLPVLRPPPPHSLPLPPDSVRCDSLTFLYLNIVAIFTGLYLLLLNSLSSESTFIARILFSGAVLLLALPIFTPGITYARGWARQAFHSKFEGSSFNLVDVEDLELHKELIGRESPNGSGRVTGAKQGFLVDLIEKDLVAVLGEEHPLKWVVRRRDFWLYYAAYFCGGTIGLVYSNNLGQISQSLGFSDRTSSIVTLYSTCSFFGRLLSAAPDFLCDKVYFARTGWFALAIVPTPIAFLLLAISGSETALTAATALIGLSSGFVFAAAVSITSELFGPNSAGVNHNILITNIPLGSILYGLVAALVYDANIQSSNRVVIVGDSMVCMGRKCYFDTFLLWGSMSLLGLVCSGLLFLRTRHAYDRLERTRNRIQSA